MKNNHRARTVVEVAVALVLNTVLSAFGIDFDGGFELSEAEKAQLRPWALWVRPKPFALPDMFLSESGRRIETREDWERIRRPEIRHWFETHMHGVRPVERPDDLTFVPVAPDRVMMDGRAVRKRVRIGYRGALGEGGFEMVAYIPTNARPAPRCLWIDR